MIPSSLVTPDSTGTLLNSPSIMASLLCSIGDEKLLDADFLSDILSCFKKGFTQASLVCKLWCGKKIELDKH